MNTYSASLLFLFISVLFSCKQSPNTYLADAVSIEKGKQLFNQQCTSCHNFSNNGIGPNLAGVTDIAVHDWLVSFIQNPQSLIDTNDERAVQLFSEYKTVMPQFSHLSKDQMDLLLAYINNHKKIVQKGTSKSLGTVLKDPISEKIKKSGLHLDLKLLTQAPATAVESPLARINKMGPLKRNSKRTFINDLNGVLYEMKNTKLEVVLKMNDHFEYFISAPGLGTGLGSFAFHPDYETNGLFYTTHTETSNPSSKTDFTYNDSIPKKMKWIVTEWKQTHPTKTVFKGDKRVLFSIDVVTPVHGVQEISFNPTAKKENPDYGMLYIAIGDGGSAEKGYLHLTQSISKIWGSILRIDPRGKNSKNGNYGIPSDNPYAAIKGAQGEVWAYGFRNPNRISWDSSNGNMLASEIGHKQIEEINNIEPGNNYGWPNREGSFQIFPGQDIDHAYALDSIGNENYTFPVLQFDHDESNAICGGFTYEGEKLSQLKGKYIFGGIVHGKIYMTNAKEFKLGSQTTIEELEITFEGNETNFIELTNNRRVDFRLGIDGENELFIFTKADGKIYEITGVQ